MTVGGADEPHITTSSGERLVHMANQISRYFVSQPRDEAVEGVRGHIGRYWDPRMRRLILEHLDAGGAGLDPVAREAVAGLKR